ncbi:ATP-dependent metallopeptidase FtsH/Yme1/Tma family protein [Anaerocolumna sp. AGMB13025]|uniref:ATP-dependent metallopeptidase FtsH/Yme1/Tma family protein n=1 Tax=Anaerocolumna sp. AGMB13025 TaxID=3039116 RepID=UPI00241CAA9E|nr:ATP-dependent metallopeptidase FtsH/Yme1/Tma family protein [Anaerocolumna sp. AGMB13025]WFR55415.1 ATP-dependent metallopeptidase FtsH/Yme1/Tma family protein [Anaerocolumna sp. AGMB13025]
MKKIYLLLLSCLILILAGAAGYQYLSKNNKELKMSYPSFISAVDQNQVKSVEYSEKGSNTFKANLYSEPDTTYTVPNPKTEDFIEFLLTNNVTVNYGQDSLLTKLLQFALLIVIGAGVFLFVRKGNGSNKPMIADSNKKSGNDAAITLNQIAGNTEAKLMVEDIIEFIKQPDKYAAVGARMPKGLLLYGPPGTGKTLMAKAIAGEAGVPFYAMSGSDFVQMYVGVGASRIRNLFNKAKKSEKAVIFIDEIDAIGKKRARNTSASNDERDQTLNALLTEMSGFHENKGIVVIGATNRLDTLDEALLRPGRFDRQIEIGLPDVNARKKILSLYAGKKPLSDDVDLEALSKSTVYFSGAMLENLLNEAAINAANEEQPVISSEHIEKAFYTVIAGAPMLDRSFISDRDRKITAYHEAGHALVTRLLQPDHYISKVTIIPSVRGAGGFNLSIPKDTMFQTQKQIKASIQMLLAGRAAEELIFGETEITTGASNDIQKASSIIVDYINKYGMDQDMGLFSTAVLAEGYDRDLVNKCRNQMNLLYGETRKLIESNLKQLETISSELLEKESLNGEDIERICG